MEEKSNKRNKTSKVRFLSEEQVILKKDLDNDLWWLEQELLERVHTRKLMLWKGMRKSDDLGLHRVASFYEGYRTALEDVLGVIDKRLGKYGAGTRKGFSSSLGFDIVEEEDSDDVDGGVSAGGLK